MNSKKTKQLHSIFEEQEYETLKAHSKETGISMNQLIKDYIKTLNDIKENTAITENFNDIKNLIASQRQILDTTAIDEEIRKTSMTMLENNYDLIETLKEKTNEDKSEIVNNTNQNFTSLIELLNTNQEKTEDKLNAIVFMIAHIIRGQFNIPLVEMMQDIKRNEELNYQGYKVINNITKNLIKQNSKPQS